MADLLNGKKIGELEPATSIDNGDEIPGIKPGDPTKTYRFSWAVIKVAINAMITAAVVGITKGDKGDTGAKGDQGIQGEKGVKGDKGDKGDPGIKGDQGVKGDPGIQGTKGDKGDKGDTGAQGVQGIKGDKGDQGDPGIDGANGDAGADGISAYEVAVNNGFVGSEADWLLSLKGEPGDQGEPGAAGADGAPGAKGDQGDPGAAGAPGVGVPTGGTTGQVLKKVDGTDYNTTWSDVPANNTKGRFEIGYACADEISNLVAGVAKIKDKAPYSFRLVAVQANVNTASTGSAIVVNIKKNGTTIFTTKLSIDATETSSLTAAIPYVFSATPIDWTVGDDIQIDLDQVGIVTAGIGLKVKLLGYIL